MADGPVSERKIVLLIGAVQFVNILDFVMVMPLGPDFARGLGISMAHVGTIGGSYTAAASVAGLVGGYFLDRFDRRKALAVAMLGLVLATAAGGLATGLTSLLVARVMAGLFGGPATSLALSILGDLIPAERRGRALGAVTMAFSLTSILGVPLSLKVAEWGGWRLPFFLVAGLGLLVVAGAIYGLPPVRRHLETGPQLGHRVGVRELLSLTDVRLSYLMTAVVMMGGFLIIPHISGFLQQNLGYPREELWQLYLAGGLVSLATVRASGILVDRFGSFRVGTAGVLLMMVVLSLFVDSPRWLPIPLMFMAFMLALGARNVAYHTLTSKVPEPAVRARFMSLQSSIQHMASAAGALLSAQLLEELPDGRLGGVAPLVGLSMALTVAVSPMLYIVERRVRGRPQGTAGPLDGVPLTTPPSR